MSNVFTLDSLRDELDKKFAPVVIDLGKAQVTLRNLLRLNSADREAVQDALKALAPDEEDDDRSSGMLDKMSRLFVLVADEGKGQVLVDAIGDDLALASHILNMWTEATSPGEASDSPS